MSETTNTTVSVQGQLDTREAFDAALAKHSPRLAAVLTPLDRDRLWATYNTDTMVRGTNGNGDMMAAEWCDGCDQFAAAAEWLHECHEALNTGMEYADFLAALDEWLAEGQDIPLPAETAAAVEAVEAAAQVAVDVAKVMKEAAAQHAKAEAEAETTLNDCVKAYSRGEKALCVAHLEAGRLADLYIHQRLDLAGKTTKGVHAAAVQAVEGQLAMHSSSTVSANRLIGCYQAYHLLGEPQATDLGKALPKLVYGYYRDAFCLVVERVNKETAAETWVILPGMEAKALELFASVVKNALPRSAAVEGCQALVKEYATNQAAAAKAAAEASKAAADKAKVADVAAEAERREAARQRQAADDVVKAAEAASKAAQTAAAQAAAQAQLDKANADREEKRKAEAVKQEAADRAAREKLAAEKAAADAAKAAAVEKARQEKAAAAEKARAEKAASKTLTVEPAKDSTGTTPAATSTTPAKDKPCHQGESILHTLARQAKANANPKDYAALLSEAVLLHDDPMAVLSDLLIALATHADAHSDCAFGPDDVLEYSLMSLEDHAGLSKLGKRACKAAHLAFSNKATAENNGQLTAAN